MEHANTGDYLVLFTSDKYYKIPQASSKAVAVFLRSSSTTHLLRLSRWNSSSVEYFMLQGLKLYYSFARFEPILRILIITRDDILLDGCFAKLKRLPIVSTPSILTSDSEFWPKNMPQKFNFRTS